jgi:hypothetical protein
MQSVWEHQCIAPGLPDLTVLVQIETPRVEDIECLCKLMSTVGSQLEASQRYNKTHMDAYFDRMDKMTKLAQLEVSAFTVQKQNIEFFRH